MILVSYCDSVFRSFFRPPSGQRTYICWPEGGLKKDRNVRWPEDGVKKDQNMLSQ